MANGNGKKCLKHPNYGGIRKPRSGCPQCLAYYQALNPDINEVIDADLIEAQYKAEIQRLKRRYGVLMKRNRDLQGQVDVIGILNGKPEPIRIRAKGSFKKGQSQAVALMMLSDWHVEEKVNPRTVNGKNSFNPEIAEDRVKRCFQNGLRLVNMLAQDVNIDTVMVALLGDFVTNYLHDDQKETNYLPPAEAVMFAYRLLCSGIEFLLNNSKYELAIPCCYGNHARMTDRKRSANLVGTSLEYIIYNMLADRYGGNSRVQFDIAEGVHLYTDVFGMRLRLHHGDRIRYQGGVGGLDIPLNKAIAQWNKIERVNFDLLGHWHQTKVDWNGFIVNGSLIGWNSYAIDLKATFEPPRQTLALFDRDRGLTVVCPIILDQIQRQVVNLAR